MEGIADSSWIYADLVNQKGLQQLPTRRLLKGHGTYVAKTKKLEGPPGGLFKDVRACSKAPICTTGESRGS